MIILIRMGIHVSRVRDLALGSRVHAVDLRGGKTLELWEVKGFGEGVDAGVLQELVSILVNGGHGRIAVEIAGAGQLAREVVACVEEFEEAADGVEVFVD